MFDPKQTLIIGTSNSIVRKGYTAVLGERIGNLMNVSLGASTSILHGLRMRELAGVQGGIAIFEHCVNESRLGQLYGLSKEIQLRALHSFLSFCGSRSIRPVILVMPHGWGYARNGPVREAYIRFAEEHQVPYFDGFAFTERVYALEPKFAACGYVGGAHIALPMMRMIGHAVARLIPVVRGLDFRFSDAGPSYALDCIHLDAHAPASRLVARKSGLDNRRLCVMRAGERLELPRQSADAVVGVVFNAGMTNGVIAVDAATRRTKMLDNVLYGSRPYVLVAWPLLSPVAIAQETFSVECLDRRAEEGDERHDHMPRTPSADPPLLEIAGLITSRAVESARYPAMMEPIRLNDVVRDEDIRADALLEVDGLAAVTEAAG